MFRQLPTQTDSPAKPSSARGFVLAFTIILILGVSAISVGTMYNGKMSRSSAISYKHKLQAFTASDGLMTLLAQELINDQSKRYVDSSRLGTIKGKKWTGIGGITINDLTSHPNYIGNTGYTNVTSNYLGSAWDQDNYGVKWSGWIIPPLSGQYYFYARSDNDSKFYLSTDASAAQLSSSPICYESGPDYYITAWKMASPNGKHPFTMSLEVLAPG